MIHFVTRPAPIMPEPCCPEKVEEIRRLTAENIELKGWAESGHTHCEQFNLVADARDMFEEENARLTAITADFARDIYRLNVDLAAAQESVASRATHDETGPHAGCLCLTRSTQVRLANKMSEISDLRAKYQVEEEQGRKLRQAVEMATELAPGVVANTEDPDVMMSEIVAQVKAALATERARIVDLETLVEELTGVYPSTQRGAR